MTRISDFKQSQLKNKLSEVSQYTDLYNEDYIK